MANYFDIIENKYNFSPSILNKTIIKNNNKIYKLSELLDRNLIKSDNGFEIGSFAYMQKSDFYFLKSKALQKNYFIPYLDTDAAIAMNKKYFKNYNLKKGDLLLSKDSNIGECVILNKDFDNYMLSSALYKLPISKNKYYIFAFMKSEYFKNQLNTMVPKGATIRHAGKKFLDCYIFFPNNSLNDNEEILILIEDLVQGVLEKENSIIIKNQILIKTINETLKFKKENISNSNINKICFNDLFFNKRIDAGFFSEKSIFQKNVLKNYKYGVSSLFELGFSLTRGQNLQVSQIGKSLYFKENNSNLYTVVKPKNFTDYGTIENFEFLGNKNKLRTLTNGDIVFSAEGTVGKCVLFYKIDKKWITNIHGIILRNKNNDIKLAAYVSCILRFYKEWGYFDHFTVGGQGGSLGKNYWKEILIPLFPEKIRENIVSLYFNDIKKNNLTNLKDFLIEDIQWNKEAGILQLSSCIKKLKIIIENLINLIVQNKFIDLEQVINDINNIY